MVTHSVQSLAALRRFALRFATMTPTTPSNLQVNIRRLRIQKEWDRTELARKARVSLPYISQLESGARTNPGMKVLRKIARALGTTVALLQADPAEHDDEAQRVAAAS